MAFCTPPHPTPKDLVPSYRLNTRPQSGRQLVQLSGINTLNMHMQIEFEVFFPLDAIFILGTIWTCPNVETHTPPNCQPSTLIQNN